MLTPADLLSEKELRHWLALWRAPKIGPRQFAILQQYFPLLSELFEQPPSLLKKFNLPLDTLLYLSKPDWGQIDKDLVWSKQPGCYIISWQDALYPPLLKEISNPPPLLFVQGDPKILSSPQLAMVGSRSPTTMGYELAQQFAKQLSLLGLVITSGLALGIDSASHQGALRGEGKTIGVMATGIDSVYPKNHKKLATEIIEKGALVTEFPLGIPVQAKHFPRRNRIVSGLSLGTLVVEASMRSGSLITARLANEQGREVFAIPGSIYNPNTRGCHYLIQQGAKLISQTKDIMDELGVLALSGKSLACMPSKKPANKNKSVQENRERTENKENREAAHLDPQSRNLLEYILFNTPTSMDSLIDQSQLTATDISSILLKLELCGIISAVPGGYIRNDKIMY